MLLFRDFCTVTQYSSASHNYVAVQNTELFPKITTDGAMSKYYKEKAIESLTKDDSTWRPPLCYER